MSSKVMKGSKVWMNASNDELHRLWATCEQARNGVVRLRIGNYQSAEATVEQARAFAAHILDMAKRAEDAGK